MQIEARAARRTLAVSTGMHAGDRLVTAVLLGWVYGSSGSASWVVLVALARLVRPVGWSPRGPLAVFTAVELMATVALVVVVGADGPLAAVAALAALGSCSGAANRAVAAASLAHRGGEAELAQAHASFRRGRDIGAFVGPALGAVALLTLDATWALGAGALLLAASGAVALVFTAAPTASPAHPAHLLDTMRQVRPVRFAIPLLTVAGAGASLTGAALVVLAVYTQDRLHLGEDGVGTLLAAAALGGVARGPLTSTAGAAPRVVVAAVGAAALAGGSFLFAALIHTPAVAVGLAVVGGAAIVVGAVVVGNTFTRVLPPATAGALRPAAGASALIGAAVAAVLLLSTSVVTAMVVVAALALVLVAAAASRLGGLDAENVKVLDRLASRIAVLQGVPIVAAASRQVVEQLAAASQVCPLPAGVDVVVEGAPAHAFYAVVDGEVVVHRAGQEVARLGPGRHFGERGLIDQAPRNAGVTTTVPSSLLRIEGAVLLGALSSSPSLLAALDAPPTALVDGGTATA